MVDALQSAWRVLRPRGLVVDFQPAAVYQPRLALVADGVRREVGPLVRVPDEDVVAAHRARQKAISEGLFASVVSTHGAVRTRYRGPTELRWLLRQNTNWVMDGALERRLAAMWARRPKGAMLEVRRTYSLAVLRKRM